MNSLFGRGPSLRIRLVLALACSFLLAFIDHRLNALQPARLFLNSLVTPIQYLAIMPEQLLDNVAESLQSRTALQQENAELREQMLVLQGRLQRFHFLQNENSRLRELLDSEPRQESRRMVAEVIAVASDPFSHQLVINKGTLNGVYQSQPVLDSRGIIGQVVSVGTNTSRIILISDQSHAIPLRAERNDLRVLAQGIGDMQQLELMFVPHSTDLEVGDMLVSSGLGGVFPEGYPVAAVTRILRDESLPFARVYAQPVAALDRVRAVLLLWPENAGEAPIYEPNDGSDLPLLPIAEGDTATAPTPANQEGGQ
ncbi:rod shape-determining protein MreC [Idiomarina xiamenensis]|uniref:Cell shape-determining protein MreC n=1 Tax=Idiomarina xiamenensis 10-D-4 TaxID=740709 RepID=K2KC11_9GAMM|nr:rod shape-determining protein MreC [Idiomarina xiamenensis]EKE85393.1 rod shape-determining protein [Idiomarina xiamenensis 10-D-4]